MTTTTAATSVAERVAAGAALLDQQLPGWEDMVFPDRLRMQSCDRCVLGQLYDGYEEGVQELFGHSQEEAIAHGFDLHAGPGASYHPADIEADCAELAAAWRAEITRRAS